MTPRHERLLPLLAFAAALALHGATVARAGVHIGPDSGTYSLWGDQLIAVRFRYGEFLQHASSVFPPRLYLAFVSWVAVCKLALGAHWAIGVVAANVLAISLLAAVVVRTALAVTRSPAAAACTGVLYLLCFEFLIWTRYVGTDTVFVLFVGIIFALLARAFLADRTPWGGVAAVLVIQGIAIFYRPTGVLLIPGVVLALAALAVKQRVLAGVRRRPAILLQGTAVMGVLAVGGAWLHAWIMQDPGRWPLRAASSIMRFNAAHYRMGEVVWDRPETFHAAPVSLGDYAAITADRFVHFFYFTLDAFSVAHNAIGVVFYLPLYLLAAVGLGECIRPASRLDARVRVIGFLALVFILTVAVFHALVQVDFDWRYRLPIIPHLLFLAAVGVARLTGGETARRAPA